MPLNIFLFDMVKMAQNIQRDNHNYGTAVLNPVLGNVC
jgi:hypothetical protein